MNTYGFKLIQIGKNRYKVSGKFTPHDMEISVIKEDQQYRAYCNYSKKTKNAAGPYQACRLMKTPEMAIECQLMFLSTEHDNSADDFQWVKQ